MAGKMLQRPVEREPFLGKVPPAHMNSTGLVPLSGAKELLERAKAQRPSESRMHDIVSGLSAEDRFRFQVMLNEKRGLFAPRPAKPMTLRESALLHHVGDVIASGQLTMNRNNFGLKNPHR